MTEQFDPAKVSVDIGGATMRAFADGVMIDVEYANDESTMHNGTDGYGRHIENLDKSGVLIVRLADYSASNAALMALFRAKVPFPVMITDKTSEGDGFQADSCKIKKRPNLVKSNEAIMNEWEINFIRGDINHAGAKDADDA